MIFQPTRSRSKLPVLFLAALLALASGCASYKVVPITAANQATAEGVRYCRPAPYLLVQPADTLRYQVIYLPDSAQTYAIQRRSGLGAAELSATFVSGWMLTAYGSKMDSKIPETLASAAAAAGSLAGKAANAKRGSAEQGGVLPPGLYKIHLTNGMLKLVPIEVQK